MQLRTYLLIDQMQPQYGALTGKTMQGEIPVEGMAEVYIESAPASNIYRVMDIALKTTVKFCHVVHASSQHWPFNHQLIVTS